MENAELLGGDVPISWRFGPVPVCLGCVVWVRGTDLLLVVEWKADQMVG